MVKQSTKGAHPEPEFNWYIADKLIGGSTNNTKEVLEDEKVDFISILEYVGNPEDIGQMLKCEVSHKGKSFLTFDKPRTPQDMDGTLTLIFAKFETT